MPRLKRLTSREILKLLGSFGFEVASIRGSHAKLVRVSDSGQREVLTIPLHSQLATGTVQAIYRQTLRFVAEGELRPEFYSD